jgi:hypothetical protein
MLRRATWGSLIGGRWIIAYLLRAVILRMTVQGIGLVAVKLFEPDQRIERNNAFALRQHQQRIDLSLENGIVVSKL